MKRGTKSQRRWRWVYALALSALLLFSAGASAQVKITLAHWTGGLETEIIDAIVQEFQKRNPHIEVELVAAHGGPWGRDKYVTMFTGGAAPDLLLLNSGNFEMFAARGWLLPLDRFAQNDPNFHIEDFLPASIEGSSLGGVLYGLPYDVSNHLPYYNKQMFAQQGLAEPGEWTWDELIDMAKKLTLDYDGDGNIDVYGLGLDAAEWHWPSIMAQFDVELFSEDGSELYATSNDFVEFMEWYYDLIFVEGIAPYDAGGINRFASQGVAIAHFGPWYRPGLEILESKFDYDIAYPPIGDRQGTIYYVDQFSISAFTAHPEEAWELLKFIAGPEAWEIKLSLSSGGRSIPPLREFALSPEFLEYGNLSNYRFLDAFAYSQRSIAGLPNGLGREFLDIWWPEMWQMWVEPQPVRPILENIQRIAEATLGFNR